MSDGRTATTAAHRVGSGAGRVLGAWRNLPQERRLAAYAAAGLFLTLFLPWYQETVVVASASRKLATASQSLTGWAAFSFVEAAVLVVALGVLTLLFQRAEGRAFHLPGGDGWVIMAAGVWTCVLVIWRIFDKQGTSNQGQVASSSGIEWGIFIALAVAAFLAYAGSRIRAAHQPEPPLPGDDEPRGPDGPAPPAPSRPRSAASLRETAGEPGREPGREAATEPRRPTRRRAQPERPVGWLSAPAEDRSSGAAGSPTAPNPPEAPAEDSATAATATQAPDQAGPPTAPTRQRHPPPVPADDPPTAPTAPRRDPVLPPSTPAARRRVPSDDQLTIPLDHDD